MDHNTSLLSRTNNVAVNRIPPHPPAFKKLDHGSIGSFRITRQINPIPPTLKIHSVFYKSLLKPYTENSLPYWSWLPPPPVIVWGQEEYLALEILDSRGRQGKPYYLEDWEGYGPEKLTWEPIENVQAPDLVKKTP